MRESKVEGSRVEDGEEGRLKRWTRGWKERRESCGRNSGPQMRASGRGRERPRATNKEAHTPIGMGKRVGESVRRGDGKEN